MSPNNAALGRGLALFGPPVSAGDATGGQTTMGEL